MNYTFEEFRELDPDKQFSYFINNLALSNKNVNYFVNWNKVYNNVRELSVALNTTNYLLGKEKIKEEAIYLFTEQPDLIKIIPSLLATRDKSFVILEDTFIKFGDELTYKHLNFKDIDRNKIIDYVEFMEQVGLLDLFKNKDIKNLEDYVLGVEVGLDSNGRKNRSGHIMEDIIEDALKDLLDDRYTILKEANANSIKNETSIDVPVNKNNRRFDFVVFDKVTEKLILIEVNFYNGGGSKLKSVAGEFTTQDRKLKEEKNKNISFLWITDGPGWKTSSRPLQEAYAVVDNIINLKMVSDGFLEEIIKK